MIPMLIRVSLVWLKAGKKLGRNLPVALRAALRNWTADFRREDADLHRDEFNPVDFVNLRAISLICVSVSFAVAVSQKSGLKPPAQ